MSNSTQPPQAAVDQIIGLYNQGQLKPTVSLAESLAKQHPNALILYDILGAAYMGLKNADKTIESYQKLLRLNPKHTDAYNNMGMALYDQGRFDEAEKNYQKAVKLEPNFADAHYNLGNALKQTGNLKQAIVSYKASLAINPNDSDVLLNYGNALKDKGDLDEAVGKFKQVIKNSPDYAEAYNSMGNALQEKGDLDEALDLYKQAIKLKPEYAEAYSNMGNALQEKDDPDAAIDLYKQAIKIKPEYAEAYGNMGIALQEKGEFDAAINSYKQAIKIKPEYAEAYYNLSFPHLMRGDLEEGFNLYEWRLRKKEWTADPARNSLIWEGEQSLSGKRFVIYEEQGLGDIIQFCRYLPLLEQKGADVTFKVMSNLHVLLKTMDSNISLKTTLPEENEIDFESPLISLPHLFNTSLETIPTTNPYLYADHDRTKTWSERLSKERFKIGICWQGSKSKIDVGRSFPLSLFGGISKISDVELISLHKGEGEDQIYDIDFDLTLLGPDFDAGQNAFVDTAAVMMNCDLIITSDTAVAHLASALGLPTWVALKHVPDWRWMLNRLDCPWYPTMALYRQKARGDWVDVFEAIEQDLRQLIDQKGL